MQNKFKILSLAIAGIAIVGCNEKEKESTDVKTVVETDATPVADTAIVADSVSTVDAEKKEESSVATPKVEKPVVADVAPEGFQVVEGRHYEEIKEELTLDQYDGITLSEFFWFGCNHCQTLEPAVQGIKDAISKDQNIRVVKEAVPGNQRWNFDTAVFHMLKELGATESQISLMLKHYEKERLQNQAYPTIEKIGEIVEEMGFSKEEGMKILNDQEFMIKKIEASNAEYSKLDTGGVPVLVVNGKYKVMFDEVKSQEDIVNIIRALGNK